MSTTAPVRSGHRRRLWITVVVLVLASAGVVVGLVVSSSGSPSRPPAFVAAPGKVRITPQPSHGAPPPQLVTVGSVRLGVILGGTEGHGAAASAGLSFIAYSDAGQPSKAFADYRAGDAITVGTVHVTVLAVWAESDQARSAVDLEISGR